MNEWMEGRKEEEEKKKIPVFFLENRHPLDGEQFLTGLGTRTQARMNAEVTGYLRA